MEKLGVCPLGFLVLEQCKPTLANQHALQKHQDQEENVDFGTRNCLLGAVPSSHVFLPLTDEHSLRLSVF